MAQGLNPFVQGDVLRLQYCALCDIFARFASQSFRARRCSAPRWDDELHDIRINKEDSVDKWSDADVAAMAEAVLAKPELAKELYTTFSKRKHNDPVELPGGISLSIGNTAPIAGWNDTNWRPWRKFLTGEWLEHWVVKRVKDVLIAAHPVHVGVECLINNGDFEIDVAMIRDHRLYLISCTTDDEDTGKTTKGHCKLKLFEASMRARQMGGDLARSALVCLADGKDDKGQDKVDALQNDVNSIWEAPNKPKVFGLRHLREWQDGKLECLKKWLDT